MSKIFEKTLLHLIKSDKVSKAFSKVIRRWCTKTQLAEIVKANKKEKDKNVCHSHDFYDANMAMFEAFTAEMKREPDLDNEADVAIMNEAWDVSKKAGFKN